MSAERLIRCLSLKGLVAGGFGSFALGFQAPHPFWIACPLELFFLGPAVKLRMHIEAALVAGFSSSTTSG
jgi:hypothetical protein